MELNSLYITELEEVLRFRSRAGDVTRIANRRCAAINAPVSGRAILRTEQQELPLDPAHPLLIPRGTTYRVEFLEDSEYLLFCFQANGAGSQAEPLPAMPVEILEGIHRRMTQALIRRAPGDTCRALSELYALFGLMGSRLARTDPAEKAAELIRAGYADPAFRCASLCRTLCLSDTRLRALFVQRYGQTPRQYLEALRMRQARLALDEQRPVGETARSVGYMDVFQFSRAYRRFFGRSPSSEKSLPADPPPRQTGPQGG